MPYAQFPIPLDILCENECRDVAVLRLYKDSG